MIEYRLRCGLLCRKRFDFIDHTRLRICDCLADRVFDCFGIGIAVSLDDGLGDTEERRAAVFLSIKLLFQPLGFFQDHRARKLSEYAGENTAEFFQNEF